MSQFEIDVWGARGSIAYSHPDLARAGCNTSCVAVTIDDQIIILDAGTGLVGLGHRIGADQGHILQMFLTHYHYDHVEGLNFFAPLRCQRTEITIHAGNMHSDATPRDVLKDMFSNPFCPNTLDDYPADISYLSFVDRQPIHLNAGATLIPVALHHPSGAYGFRIEHAGRIFVYAPDFEIGDAAGDAALLHLLRDADLALLDAMFTPPEIAGFKGYGHSEWQAVAKLCATANAGAWRMFHHAPQRTDAALDRIEADLQAVYPECGAAREGDRYDLLG